MKIVIISDTHLMHDRVELPAGDILIHAGDCSWTGKMSEISMFDCWMAKQDFKHKIVIAGNHDWYFQNHYVSRHAFNGFTYLQDDFVVIEGVKIYGAPWQPKFYDWAFNLPRGKELADKWSLIPDDTDILITHGPAFGYCDLLNDGETHIGCNDLLKAIVRVKPKYHICGHIHPAYGITKGRDTTFINASICNEEYEPVNKPIVIEI